MSAPYRPGQYDEDEYRRSGAASRVGYQGAPAAAGRPRSGDPAYAMPMVGSEAGGGLAGASPYYQRPQQHSSPYGRPYMGSQGGAYGGVHSPNELASAGLYARRAYPYGVPPPSGTSPDQRYHNPYGVPPGGPRVVMRTPRSITGDPLTKCMGSDLLRQNRIPTRLGPPLTRLRQPSNLPPRRARLPPQFPDPVVLEDAATTALTRMGTHIKIMTITRIQQAPRMATKTMRMGKERSGIQDRSPWDWKTISTGCRSFRSISVLILRKRLGPPRRILPVSVKLRQFSVFLSWVLP